MLLLLLLRLFILGGGIYFLAVQGLAVICITFWGLFSTFLLLWLVNKITPLRMKIEDEILGADYTEHNIMPSPTAIVRDIKSSSDDAKRKDDEESNVVSRGAFRLHDSNKMADIYKTYFTQNDRSESAAAHENPTFQHDNAWVTLIYANHIFLYICIFFCTLYFVLLIKTNQVSFCDDFFCLFIC